MGNGALTNRRVIGRFLLFFSQCFAHISGAHFNPAVTLLALIMKLVDVKTAVVYLISQCIGGALGYGLLKVTGGKRMHNSVGTLPAAHKKQSNIFF